MPNFHAWEIPRSGCKVEGGEKRRKRRKKKKVGENYGPKLSSEIFLWNFSFSE